MRAADPGRSSPAFTNSQLFMQLALAQLNLTVGDLQGNSARIADSVRRASKAGAELVVTSELSLLGYPPRDLLLSGGFIARSLQALNELARELKGLPPTLVGFAEPTRLTRGRPLYNSAALLHDGRIQSRYRKTLLPNYDVFDEERYFEPGGGPGVLPWSGAPLGITICEDLWNDASFWSTPRYHVDPMEVLSGQGVGLVVNLSASPFAVGKQLLRESMLSASAKRHGVPIVYVNQVGGNDDLIFDGRSRVFGANGGVLHTGKSFEEDFLLVNPLAKTGRVTASPMSEPEETWRGLVLGVRDYVRKCGFQKVLFGLSGGIDSAVTACIAAEAVGSENVLAVLMPSPHSSRGSVEDSRLLAENLGIRTTVLPIQNVMDAYERTLRREFAGLPASLAEENLQARIRGTLLMALSNKFGALLLTTGNKSELAVGYCTLYGDMNGGLAVISDVYKCRVYELARWLNRDRDIIPSAIIKKAPSAELRPGQRDDDSLPPYELLDQILVRLIEQHESQAELLDAGLDKEAVELTAKLVQRAEFKRRQAAPGLKISQQAFGTGWRLPIACRLDDSSNDSRQALAG